MPINLNSTDLFANRHIGVAEEDLREMLKTIGVKSLNDLISRTIPASIRLSKLPELPAAQSEFEYLEEFRGLSRKNKVFRSYIGMGYYGTLVPPVIFRNILENPGWYTQYTPYQAEIAQGRLEALLNFQTMVTDLTGMELANASLLDESTAASEAMIMFYNYRNKRARTPEELVKKFFVGSNTFPQTIDVIRGRAEYLGIEIVIGDPVQADFDETFFGALVQYPDLHGKVMDYRDFINKAKDKNVYVTVATDLMSLTLLEAPGNWGADCAVGNSQRFGVPMGFGGPHAAFFATTDEFKRNMPGRIIGVSEDAAGKTAYRMALQTREQHIKREKATSNICTAQALLAIMAGMYAAYHGPAGLKNIALRIHSLSAILRRNLEDLGLQELNGSFFDTLRIKSDVPADKIRRISGSKEINFCWHEDGTIGIALDETTRPRDVRDIVAVFAEASGKQIVVDVPDESEAVWPELPAGLSRESAFMTHPVFNRYHSEAEMTRYIKRLENRDLSMTTSMISLGSCTMKLNATAEMFPISWTEWSRIHPFASSDQTAGYLEVVKRLENYLSSITGLAATSLQPNSGAQGEYAGLLVILAYHRDRGDHKRKTVLIPSSAHGTNPASAVMAGMEVVVTPCDEKGNIDVEALRAKAMEHRDVLAGLMVTYPSTHGVFEESIREICSIIHECGGLVYMDGANMNAQVGLTNPAVIGADVCHLNLHKTFAIPHGGGGPGMGPICVIEKLAPYLPGHAVVKTGGLKAIHAVSAAPWGSASILLVSYGYIRLLGQQGVTDSTKYAILNANYLKSKLESHYKPLYVAASGTVAHEFILDFRPFKQSAGIEVEDIAKRLMDYGFHAPTVSFPVAGTLMIEPTESESKAELDRFVEAMIGIRKEIRAIEEGRADVNDNVLKNAPHTADEIMSSAWSHPYSREEAAFPAAYIRNGKFWPFVSRINNTLGDRVLVCTCPPVAAYEKEVVSSQ